MSRKPREKHGTVYERPGTGMLWFSFYDETGKRVQRSSGYTVEQRELAEKRLAILEKEIAGVQRSGTKGPVTVAGFAKAWLEKRMADPDISSSRDEANHLNRHVLPTIGSLRLTDVRVADVRNLVAHLRIKETAGRKQGAPPERLAARTVLNVYGTLHRMFHEAVIDGLIAATPCVLAHGDLPKKRDKDPSWRAGAVFEAEEISLMVSDHRIPEDRRTLYAVLFFLGLRFGEGSALRWRHYDPTAPVLGRMLIVASFDSRTKTEGATKTETTRHVPVHPGLAAILADWHNDGWKRMMGREPGADDLIVPGRMGRNRTANQSGHEFMLDQERIELRRRTLHNLRATFTTLAEACGASRDVIRRITHTSQRDIMDGYVRTQWPTMCQEVAKLKVDLPTAGNVPEGEKTAANLPTAGHQAIDNQTTLPVTVPLQSPEFAGIIEQYGGSAR
ncbi:MAG: hypothetical protein V2A73_07485, partial [Pseudomonadota bacterium]